MRLRDLGVFNAALYLASRVLQRLTGSRAYLLRYYLVVQPVNVPIRLPRRLGGIFTVREVGPADPEARALPRPRDIIDARYAQGSTCIALYCDTDLAGFIWLCPGAYLEDEVRCAFIPVPPGRAAWDYDLYVVPEHRNSVAFMKLWSLAMEHLRTRGIAWSASRISAFAPGSLAAHRRLGAIRVGQAFFLTVFELQIMLATIQPFVHVSLSGRSRPTLRVVAPVQS